MGYDQAKSSEPGMLLIDDKDWGDNQADYENLLMPDNWIFRTGPEESMGDKVRAVWDLFVFSKWPYLCLLNDDHVPITKEWDKKLISLLDGKNFVTCNDAWFGHERACGATIWSRDLLLAVGYVFPPTLQHLFIDNVWEDLGNATECWKYEDSVVVRHNHAFRTGVLDETHRIGYGNWSDDELTYHTWRVKEKPQAVDRIRKLKGV